MLGNVIRRPVEAFGEVAELDGDRRLAVALGHHRQRRPRRKIVGHAVVDHPLGQARAAERLVALGGLDDHARVRPGLDDRILLGHLAGRAIGAAEGDAPLEIGVDQPRRRDQPGIAVLLAHAIGEAGDDRAFGQQSLRDTLEPDQRETLARDIGVPEGLLSRLVAQGAQAGMELPRLMVQRI